MERRRFKFKVPKGLKSIKEEQEANVAFKNLTEELIHLYWINHEGQAIYHGELKPVDRSDKGFLVCTYVTHPWVAIYGKKQALMNGRKYFFPPGNHKWNEKPLGWVRKRWNFLTQDDVDNEEANFEVLILESALVDAESGAFVDIELNNVCAEINDLVAAFYGQKAYISEFVEVDESDVLISFLKHTGEIIMLTN